MLNHSHRSLLFLLLHVAGLGHEREHCREWKLQVASGVVRAGEGISKHYVTCFLVASHRSVAARLALASPDCQCYLEGGTPPDG